MTIGFMDKWVSDLMWDSAFQALTNWIPACAGMTKFVGMTVHKIKWHRVVV